MEPHLSKPKDEIIKSKYLRFSYDSKKSFEGCISTSVDFENFNKSDEMLETCIG